MKMKRGLSYEGLTSAPGVVNEDEMGSEIQVELLCQCLCQFYFIVDE